MPADQHSPQRIPHVIVPPDPDEIERLQGVDGSCCRHSDAFLSERPHELQEMFDNEAHGLGLMARLASQG